MKKITIKTAKIVSGITNPYTRRILSNLIGKNPFAVYCQTPSRLTRLLAGITPAQAQRTTTERRWSITQIINHLCDAEIITSYRFRIMLAQSGTTIQAYDEKRWADNLRYDAADWRAKLVLFIALRNDNIAMLKKLSAREWQRFGIHSERGKETVERMMQMIAGHDLNHLQQIKTLRSAHASSRRR